MILNIQFHKVLQKAVRVWYTFKGNCQKQVYLFKFNQKKVPGTYYNQVSKPGKKRTRRAAFLANEKALFIYFLRLNSSGSSKYAASKIFKG